MDLRPACLGAFVKNVSLGRLNLTTGKLKPKIDLFVPFGRTARLSKNKGFFCMLVITVCTLVSNLLSRVKGKALKSMYIVVMYNNISSVVEFQRWWVLKSKIFA